jgi:hypothetical protein
MSFPTVPLLVMDEILGRLDISALFAISHTCKLLNYHANRFLYRDAPPIYAEVLLEEPELSDPTHGEQEVTRLTQLENSIRLHPSNSRYLQIYATKDLKHLTELWKRAPLTLKHLYLCDVSTWYRRFGEDSFREAVDEKYPTTRIESMSIHSFSCLNSLEHDYHYSIARSLYRFVGLKKLTITIPVLEGTSYMNPAFVLRRIRCPQLEHLVLRSNGASGLACPGHAFPNLKIFEIWTNFVNGSSHPSQVHGLKRSDDIRTLRALVSRNILFRYGNKPSSQFSRGRLMSPHVLLDFIDTHSGVGIINTCARWILRCEYELRRLEEGPDVPFALDLSCYENRERWAVVKVLRSMNIQSDFHLSFCLSPIDRPSSFPKSISHLEIVVHGENFPPSLIPAIISSLPRLRKIEIAVFTQVPLHSPWDAQEESHPRQLNYSDEYSCFESPITFPLYWPREDGDIEIDCYRATIKEGACVWSIASPTEYLGENVWFDAGNPAELFNGFYNLENEILSLSLLNPMLKEITVDFYWGEVDRFDIYGGYDRDILYPLEW